MAERNKLVQVERERGDLHKVIPPLVNAGGQKAAAAALNVTQATISGWLRKNGYQQIVKWERERAS